MIVANAERGQKLPRDVSSSFKKGLRQTSNLEERHHASNTTSLDEPRSKNIYVQLRGNFSIL